MSKYSRYCRVCCEPLGKDSYIVSKNGKLTANGDIIFRITKVDIRSEDSHICKGCYRAILAIQRIEDDLTTRKGKLKSKFEEACIFFSASKRVRGLSSTPQQTRTTQPVSATNSPANKRTKVSGSSVRTLFEPIVPETEKKCSSPLRIRTLDSVNASKATITPSKIPRLSSRIPLPIIKPAINLENVQFIIDEECGKLCSLSGSRLFRNQPTAATDQFSWDMYAEELQQLAPVLWAVLTAASTSLETKYKRRRVNSEAISSCVVAAAMLLKRRNMHMSAVQHWLSLLLWHGNASTMTLERLNHLNLTIAPRTLYRTLNGLSLGFDHQVRDWMKDGSRSFQLVIDNVDVYQKPRYMTAERKPKMYHWVQIYAIRNRINEDLPDDKPKGKIGDATSTMFVPTAADCNVVRKHFIILVSRILVEHVACLRILKDYVPTHIPHAYSKEMAKASDIVPLGVLLKDENKTEDMIEILELLEKYVPKDGDKQQPLFIGGDQLTCERIRGAKKARLQAMGAQRLDGLLPKAEDWHALQAYYKVIWETLYSTSSGRDKGTLFQLRTLIDRRNVVTDPKKDLHACQSFLTTVLEALILATFASQHNLSSLDVDLDSLLKDGTNLITSKERIGFLNQLASGIVDCTFLCPTDSQLVVNDDMSNYMFKLLAMGLLAWDMEDAIREGDGERIILLWKFLLLQFKQAGKTKYALEAVHLLYNLNIALSQKRSHELLHNRTCNTRGVAGNNKPLDLHMEHMNRDFKDNISTFSPHLSELSVEKISHASPIVEKFIAKFDAETNIRQDSGLHTSPSQTTDRQTIFEQLLKENACTCISGRQYVHYRDVQGHVYSHIMQDRNWDNFNSWLKSKLRELDSASEYAEYQSKKQ